MPATPEPLFDARILLVDDDPGAIQALGSMLAGYGQLRFATGGAAALALLHDWLPELILLDAEMPGMSGFEMLQHLQADAALAEVPVIVVSQHDEPAFEVAAFEFGAADFVTKPAAATVLRARVATQLRMVRLGRRLAADQDHLTGVASRARLEQRLAVEWARARRSGRALSLLLVDIDHFAAYQQAQGGAAADACLRTLSQIVQALVQRPGDLAARDGEGSFALLLPDTDEAGAECLAGHLRAALDTLALPHPVYAHAAHVTASIGVGTQPAGGRELRDAQALRQAAEAALQRARLPATDAAAQPALPH